MTIPHVPETNGTVAVYQRDNGGYLDRDVIAWDRQGRPLVMCGDRLQPATTAPFANHKKYCWLQRAEPVSEQIAQRVMARLESDFYYLGRALDLNSDDIRDTITAGVRDAIMQMKEKAA